MVRDILEGTDRTTGKTVGLKLLDPEKCAAFEARFKGLKKPSEGEIALKLKHPRIVETLEYDNLIAQAAVTVVGANNRQESRGAHAREDFPNRDDVNWMKHTLAWADYGSKQVTLDFRPVHTYTMTNEMSYIEPKARVY